MRTIFAILFTFVFCSTAYAEWKYHGEDSVLGGLGTYLTIVESNDHALIFRCREDGVGIEYWLPRKWDPEQYYPVVELLVRVDDGEVESLAGERYSSVSADPFHKVVVVATSTATLLNDIRDAKRRVVVGYREYGKLHHEQSFPVPRVMNHLVAGIITVESVRGSTRVMNQLIEDCPAARRIRAID